MDGHMVYKIIRGALLGIILGGCIGILVSNGLRLLRINQETSDASIDLQMDGMEIYEDAVSVMALEDGYGTQDKYIEQNDDCVQDKLVRFHVRANSDSDEDIALKYEVRDAVLHAMSDGLKDAKSKEQALIYLAQHLQEIKKTAEDTLMLYGYDYPVRVYIARDDFPIREYGNVVLPAGNYQALRIDIGEAKGENFWCILYPMMCYTIDSGAVIDSTDEDALERELTEEEFEKLFVHQNEEKQNVKIEFKFLKWISSL